MEYIRFPIGCYFGEVDLVYESVEHMIEKENEIEGTEV